MKEGEAGREPAPLDRGEVGTHTEWAVVVVQGKHGGTRMDGRMGREGKDMTLVVAVLYQHTKTPIVQSGDLPPPIPRALDVRPRAEI